MKENNFFSKYLFIALALSTYPVTILYTSNFQNTNLFMYIIPLGIVYLFTTIVYSIFYLLRNKLGLINYPFASIIVSIFFFTYGIYYSFLSSQTNFLGLLSSHRFLLPIIVIIIIGLTYLLNKINKTSVKYNFLLIFLITLNLTPFINLVDKIFIDYKNLHNNVTAVNNYSFKDAPNIYFIILDGYGSENSIKSFLKYDNSQFYNQLKEIGFRVQDNAVSNYNRTSFSLSSTLNLNYINRIIKSDIYYKDLERYISHNKVAKILKSYGYSYYFFDSGFGLKKTEKNEFLINTKENYYTDLFFSSSDNDLLNVFLNNSAFKIFKNPFFSDFIISNYAYKVLNVYKKLPSIAKNNKKKFVFAHVISPHPPFLFNKSGKIGMYGIDNENEGVGWNEKLYIEQLKYINFKTIILLNKIIKNDKKNKIILIQGDHGSRCKINNKKFLNKENWVNEQFHILNAIYISKNDNSKRKIYENWNYSSVNTFRIIFNEYFKSNYSNLKDVKYYSDLHEPYNFIQIKKK
ncbi:sulfatase-like hydrolase/transferase [Flavobacterium sp.]|uniref:sulfatase-like hydrolase/transferase n=1 Tax=Flavobacterium sp. TaxID=239 RepID=UPI0025D4C86D|nr:sulfatase-like hydrolase/transferase [Flavobacterium sp.]